MHAAEAFQPPDKDARGPVIASSAVSAHRRFPLLIALAALVLLPCGAPAQEGPPAPLYGIVDQGAFKVTFQEHALGRETFEIAIHAESLYVMSEYRQPMRQGDSLRRTLLLVVRHFDNDLIAYKSTLRLPDSPKITRGVTLGDTVVNVYRESETGGEGVTFVRPPGRLFVVESNLYALLDLLFRDLNSRQGWTTRPVNLVVVGERDTVVQATARSLGPETTRWGNGPITANKYSVSDGRTEFVAWMAPKGYTIRIEVPAIGLRVEREAPPVRRAPAKKPAP
jgi:hypothetical protein